MTDYKKLGVLIEAIRKKRGYSITGLLDSDYGKLCDRHTYKKIKDGQVLVDKRIYEDIVKRLGYENITDNFNHDFNELWRCMDYYDIQGIEVCINEFNEKFAESHNHDIYLDVVSEILDMITSYFVSKKTLDSRTIVFLTEIYEIFDESLLNCVLLLLGYNLQNAGMTDCEKIIEYLSESEEGRHRISALKYYLVTERYFEAVRLQMGIEEILDHENHVQVLDFLDASNFLAERTNSKEKKYRYMFETKLAEVESEIPITKFIQYYGNVGITALLSRDYEASINSFLKIQDYSGRRMLTIYNYLLFNYSQLGEEPPEYLYELKTSDDYTADDKDLYYYFVRKRTCTNRECRMTILSILKTIPLDSKVYLMILETEMHQLCDDIKKYADYHKYMKILKKRVQEETTKK